MSKQREIDTQLPLVEMSIQHPLYNGETGLARQIGIEQSMRPSIEVGNQIEIYWWFGVLIVEWLYKPIYCLLFDDEIWVC